MLQDRTDILWKNHSLQELHLGFAAEVLVDCPQDVASQKSGILLSLQVYEQLRDLALAQHLQGSVYQAERSSQSEILES